MALAVGEQVAFVVGTGSAEDVDLVACLDVVGSSHSAENFGSDFGLNLNQLGSL
jgi:hypothetical protein